MIYKVSTHLILLEVIFFKNQFEFIWALPALRVCYFIRMMMTVYMSFLWMKISRHYPLTSHSAAYMVFYRWILQRMDHLLNAHNVKMFHLFSYNEGQFKKTNFTTKESFLVISIVNFSFRSSNIPHKLWN